MPATNSSESPGRIGNSTPDSTKMTTSSPTSAQVPKYPSSFIGSRKSGMSASWVVAAGRAVVVIGAPRYRRGGQTPCNGDVSAVCLR